MACRTLILVVVSSTVMATAASRADVLSEFEPEVPVVLSPVRLQQPLPEVPASVTVISAEQIRQWGIQRLVDVFQYVPGMFVAQELDSNQSSVVYHSGSLSLSRRLEVLVDGRSAYLATFASVDWDQLNIALEDIERIEITRGPSASSYGMNAFQGIINIVTRHPSDSRRLAISTSIGSDGRKRGYASSSFAVAETDQRLSAFANREGSTDYANISDTPDQNWVEGFSWAGSSRIGDDSELQWQAGRQRLRRMVIGDDNFHSEQPRQRSISDALSLQWKSLSGQSHDWQVRANWHAENQEKSFSACTPTIAYDTNLTALYKQDRALGRALGYGVLPLLSSSTSDSEKQQIQQLYAAIAAGLISAAELQVYMQDSGVDTEITDEEYALTQAVAASAVAANGLDEVTCGTGDYDLYEQRLSLEIEHTYWWNAAVRSVQGLSFRRDEVNSSTYFGRRLASDSILAFGSLEYRMSPDWLLFLSLTAEKQTDEPAHYSPRVALTHLLDAGSSLRFQYAKTHRTPDLAERYLDATVTVRGLTDNYLGLDSGELFLTGSTSDWESVPRGEVIHAWELGYFIMLNSPHLMYDIKLFHERMDRLVEGQVNLLNNSLGDDGALHLTGLEWQLDWQLNSNQKLWLVGLLQDRNSLSGRDELELGAEKSLRLAWTSQFNQLETMLGLHLDQGIEVLSRNNRGSTGYRQRKVVGRIGSNLVGWNWSLSTTYDADAGDTYYERNPRWLNWASLGYKW
ncbi:TonB-dependent receptor plug domain-containing protein [Oceanobacter mangrovi]|uniref:TonB-dependent receptor plug domain-containing protein n=1 Tax=Oceanobacter mangrovi TaxID=2862510 RepID=UPI001C8D7B8A|nr:TonB-dependent receptor [Oceanobacter mangrovi]